MRCLLEIKPGHLWIILFGVPLAIMVAGSMALVGPDELRSVQTGWIIIFHLWLWSVGLRAQDQLPPEERLGVGLFCAAVLILVVVSLAATYPPGPLVELFNRVRAAKWLFWALFLAIDLYAQIFVARVIIRAEVHKGQPESGVVSTVLLFWILPAGLLPLQQRCNALVNSAAPSA